MVNFRKPLFIMSVIGTGVGSFVLFRNSLIKSEVAVDPDTYVENKVFIVTGSNTGIGKETARELAKRKGIVYMACRDMEKCEKAREEIIVGTKNPRVKCMKCDLADFNSIREFVKNFKAKESKLDVLINNAGVMRCPRMVTKQGIELQLGVNHMGHFLLTNLLLDCLKNAAPSRIINVSSVAHERGHINFEDLNSEKKYSPSDAYNQSKLANILFTRELAKKLEGTGVTVNAVHPGIVYTELGRHMSIEKSSFSKFVLSPIFKLLMKTPREGAVTTLQLALDPKMAEFTGMYFVDSIEYPVSEEANDDAVAARLWAVSMVWTRLATADQYASIPSAS